MNSTLRLYVIGIFIEYRNSYVSVYIRFGYLSEAPNEKLQKWISISLRDIGINPETGADIVVKPGAIQIVLTTMNKNRGSIGNPLKYN